MNCKRCNSKKGLVVVKGIHYCRDCIAFKRVLVDEDLKKQAYCHENDQAKYHLEYQLTYQQLQVSTSLLNNYRNHKNSIVQAVCGSGKTEIVYASICHALQKKQHVCFALPRRELAIEIYQRLKEQIQACQITLVYGGHCEVIEGDIVVCTTHQLFRYHQSFDLLIIDEVDAFPFYGNDVLYHIALQACKGKFIFLSATLSKADIALEAEIITLFRRYHGYDLPVPKIKILPLFLIYIDCVYRIKMYKRKKQLVLLFVPTIASSKKVFETLRYFSLCCGMIHSKVKDKETILQSFKNKEFDVLITTTLLERGVTFTNVNVLVFNASHKVFTTSTLIQIAGRVGRKLEHPTGDVFFYDQKRSKAMNACIKEIRNMNTV